MESWDWFVAGRQALGRKGKVVRHANFDAAFRRYFVGMSVGVGGKTVPSFGGGKFGDAGGRMSITLLEAGHRFFEVSDVFIDPERPQMLQGILANLLILAGLIGRRPQHARRLKLAGMLRHL